MTSSVDVSICALGLGKALVQVRLVNVALLDIVTVNAAHGSSFPRVSNYFSSSVLYTTVIRENSPFTILTLFVRCLPLSDMSPNFFLYVRVRLIALVKPKNRID